MPKPPWQRKFRQWRWRQRWWLQPPARLVRWLWRWIEPAWPALALAIVLILVLWPLRPTFPQFGELGKGIYVAAWGTFLDVVFVAVILVIFETMRRRRESIERYIEEIEDYKKWDSEEARLRIAGNIRRLARLGKTDIDFSGIVLRNFAFSGQDIESLKGATFSLGLRLDRMSKNSTTLENVDFSHVDCSGVIFSQDWNGFTALGLVGKNLGFTSTNLTAASFAGARLSWTNYKADKSEWFIDHGEDDEGRPMTEQAHYPAFAEADLKGCSFRSAQLDHADFRDARNIAGADFSGAKGLETCFFDEDVRDKILLSAKLTPKPDDDE